MDEILNVIETLKNTIKTTFIGRTIYYFGSACDKFECPECGERCDIGCKTLRTPVIKSFVIKCVSFSQITTPTGETKDFVTFDNHSISKIEFELNKLNTAFFLTEDAIREYQNTHSIDEITIKY